MSNQEVSQEGLSLNNSGGSGAGLGGAIFVKAGRLVLSHTTFQHNAAIGGMGIEPGQGKGGAIFVVTAELGAQAEIAKPPIVVVLGSSLKFTDNFASDAQNTSTDNVDVYGVIAQS